MFEVKYLMAISVFEYASFGNFSLAPGRIRAYKQHCALKFSGQSTPPYHAPGRCMLLAVRTAHFL